jgi:hypothetical protein
MTRTALSVTTLLLLAACAAKQVPAPDVSSDVLEPDTTTEVAPDATSDVPVDQSAPAPADAPEITDDRGDAPEVQDPKDPPIERPDPKDEPGKDALFPR